MRSSSAAETDDWSNVDHSAPKPAMVCSSTLWAMSAMRALSHSGRGRVR